MAGNLDFEQLRVLAETGEIDTVVAAQTDMQGRLVGKRFHAQHFVDEAWAETHSCNYLLATDMEMQTVQGYAATSWAGGYGDYVMRPDLTTLRRIPWLPGTALVLCDVLDHHGKAAVPHSPRAVLQRQLARLEAMGYRAMAATELEFFLFRESLDDMRDLDWRGMTPISAYNEDYHVFQTTKEEEVMRAVRNGLYGAGVPVECSKGEAEAGQEEINVRYADALTCADHHVVTKNAVKEIAWAQGRAVTFMAKWSHDHAGSSSHIHQSLQTMDGRPAFLDPDAEHGMSGVMRSWLAGLLAHSAEITWFLAPYVNSYKRFTEDLFAPTRAVWSVDNRTAGYRVVAPGGSGIRVECRIGGADLNPYLALAALIAAGIAGLEQELELEPALRGNAYQARRARRVPGTLREAERRLSRSKMLRHAFGEEVVDHYVRAARWEQEDFDRKVTDYEVRRGFERA
ncbi:glutamine synthetase family protein [Minwuia thermotolerans]|uniref:Glutamine synthetase n=1 Tax=Minwuia thermotolerans TaxID=2056226 RepID=A0A2M9FVV2_9PROT|nr:glutamine synthetase family protein [Minwuia thermotolerans]PJK27590.1 glutamine synthetase [Minwuia thermotolerans]